MRGRAALPIKLLKKSRRPPVDPSSVGFADTFSRKGTVAKLAGCDSLLLRREIYRCQ
jgi:hypothetical protein